MLAGKAYAHTLQGVDIAWMSSAVDTTVILEAPFESHFSLFGCLFGMQQDRAMPTRSRQFTSAPCATRYCTI